MKKTAILLIVATLILTLLIPLSASAAEVYVSHAEIGIVVNGRGVNNSFRKYPFIVYNSITYFPMTYNDCAYLGLSNTWTPGSGNIIEKAEEVDCYDDFLNPLQNDEDKGGMATVATTPVTVLGTRIDNSKEQYPILNYRNLLYFPLTWDWGNKFGWSITFTENNVLEVATENYKDKGSYYVFDLYDGKVSKANILGYRGDVYALNGQYKYYSFSPDYTLLRNADVKGFVQLYRLLDGGLGEKGITYINVKKGLENEFIQNGWFTGDKLDEKIAIYLQNHTIYEASYAINGISTMGTNDAFKKRANAYYFGELRDNYESLYKSPTVVCAVRKEQVPAYTASGWMRSGDFLLSLVRQKENAKQYQEAMKIISCVRDDVYYDNYGIDMPSIDYYDRYDEVEGKFISLAQKVYGSGGDGVKFAYTYKKYSGNYAVFAIKFKPGNEAVDFTVTYDLARPDGTIVHRGLSSMCGGYTYNNQRYVVSETYLNTPDEEVYIPVNIKVSNVSWSLYAAYGAG